MFYDCKLMKSSKLGVVWCYAHGQKNVSDNVGMPKICSKIAKFVNYNGNGSKRRLSLKSSTLLLNGTARLYKDDLDKLYQDCIDLESDMLYCRFRNALLSDDNSSGSEGNLRNSKNGNDNNNHRNSNLNDNINSEVSRIRSKDSIDREGSAVTSFNSDPINVSNQTYTIDKIDAEVQTNKSYIRNMKERGKRRHIQAPDVNLPIGVMIEYDEFNSNRPNRIICANINKKVKYL